MVRPNSLVLNIFIKKDIVGFHLFISCEVLNVTKYMGMSYQNLTLRYLALFCKLLV